MKYAINQIFHQLSSSSKNYFAFRASRCCQRRNKKGYFKIAGHFFSPEKPGPPALACPA
jgi:hypothetical protein